MANVYGGEDSYSASQSDDIPPVTSSFSSSATMTTTAGIDKNKKVTETISSATTDQNDSSSNESNHNQKAKNESTSGSGPAVKVQEQQQQQRLRRVEIEGYKRFSQSIIWNLMMRFYDEQGEKAWADGIVPHFVSSNAFIGKSYAKLIYGYIMDLCSNDRCGLENKNSQSTSGNNSNDTGENDDVYYIVEIGSGTGKLCFYILKALEEMKRIDFPFDKIVYILTDFTQSNISFWKQQSNLSKYVKDGRLDFCQFEAVNDEELKLLHSGKILKRGDLKHPLCIVANYLIDTLCNDAFQIEKGGILKEGLVSVGVKKEQADNNDEIDAKDRHAASNIASAASVNDAVDRENPDIFNHLWNEYEYRTIDTNYYTDSIVHKDDIEHYSNILSWYKNYFKEYGGASILIPIGFLSGLRHLSDLSSGKAFIITGDKGNANPDYFVGLSNPHMAVHGSFSLMVNFHAICLYVKSRGGFALTGDQEESALQVNCFVLNGNEHEKGCEHVDHQNHIGSLSDDNDEYQRAKYPKLCHSFGDIINTFNPNDFFVLQKSLKEEGNPSLVSILSLLRLSSWDPDVFYKFRDSILSFVSSAGPRLRADLLNGIIKLWDNYFHLGKYDSGKDIAFELGRLCYGLSLFEEALEYYRISLDLYGDHHITYHNSGLCHYSLFNYETAKGNFRMALDMRPDYEKSKTWLERTDKELMQDSDLIPPTE